MKRQVMLSLTVAQLTLATFAFAEATRELPMSKFFKPSALYEGVTSIGGVHAIAYVIQGPEKALLIDTITGVGSLKSFVRELTDLPLYVVNTHGHVDHVGGNAEFERVYMHPLDIAMSYHQMTVAYRTAFIGEKWFKDYPKLGMPITKADLIPNKPYYVIPVTEGEYFDLGGGRLIEVIHVPGHSRGSIALLDVQERVLFIGDSLCGGTQICLQNSTSVEEYLDSLKHLKTHAHRFDRMFWSHSTEIITPDRIDEGIALCEEIIAGTDDAVPHPEHPVYLAKKRENMKWVNIRYDKRTIFKEDLQKLEGSKKIVDYKTRSISAIDGAEAHARAGLVWE